MIQSNYKIPLYIDEELEKIIRFLCNKYPDNEWSGNLLYISSGSINDKNLKLYAKYLILKNIGSKTFTEFNEDIIEILQIKSSKNLNGCNEGLIHSHNTMETFFSSTDINTLKEKSDNGTFLSLIVNNIGTYNAKVSVKCHTKCLYKSKVFEEEVVINTVKDDILVFDCNIIKNEFKDEFILKRLNELELQQKNNKEYILLTSNIKEGIKYNPSLWDDVQDDKQEENENMKEKIFELERFINKIIKTSKDKDDLTSPKIDKRIKSYISQREESFIINDITHDIIRLKIYKALMTFNFFANLRTVQKNGIINNIINIMCIYIESKKLMLN